MKHVAEVLSFVFHPVIFFLIMPFLIVYRFTANHEAALRWEIFSAVFVAIAVTIVLWGRKRGVFSDFDISKKEERYEFYACMLFFGCVYIASSVFIRGLLFPMTLIAITIACGIAFLDRINRYIKVSSHTAVSSAFVTTIGLLYGVAPFLALCWIVPILTWARISLRRHTRSEALTGAFVGVVLTVLTFVIGEYIY